LGRRFVPDHGGGLLQAHPQKDLFGSAETLAIKSEPIDPITVSNVLNARHELEAIGGQSYLAEMMNTFPVAGNIEYYAKIVAEKSTIQKSHFLRNRDGRKGLHK
jgi:replicative DNA helicase